MPTNITYGEIQQLLLTKGHVYLEIKNDLEFWDDSRPDNGMRCQLLALEFSEDPEDGCYIRAQLDLTPFTDWNRAVASHDWYDADGNNGVTWFESGEYPKDGKCEVIFNGKLTDESKVFSIYYPEESIRSYAQLTWEHCADCNPAGPEACMKCWREWLLDIGSRGTS